MNDLASSITTMQQRADELERQIELIVSNPHASAEVTRLTLLRSDYLKLIAQWTLPMMRTT
jgi:hypothetical protein